MGYQPIHQNPNPKFDSTTNILLSHSLSSTKKKGKKHMQKATTKNTFYFPNKPRAKKTILNVCLNFWETLSNLCLQDCIELGFGNGEDWLRDEILVDPLQMTETTKFPGALFVAERTAPVGTHVG